MKLKSILNIVVWLLQGATILINLNIIWFWKLFKFIFKKIHSIIAAFAYIFSVQILFPHILFSSSSYSSTITSWHNFLLFRKFLKFINERIMLTRIKANWKSTTWHLCVLKISPQRDRKKSKRIVIYKNSYRNWIITTKWRRRSEQ